VSLEELITERDLDAFRARHLIPTALMALLERCVHALLRLAVGVGKSVAAEELLLWLPLYERFNLVIYLAPTWNILNERIARLHRDQPEFAWMVVRPRPREMCGKLNEPWSAYEVASCSTLAKEELCRKQCPKYRHECLWPDQYKDIEGMSLVLLPEKHAELNRALVPFLRQRTDQTRVLVILDEARLLDAKFELRLTRAEIERFAEAVGKARDSRGAISGKEQWLADITRLLTASEAEFREGAFSFVPWLHRHAFSIQKAGWRLYRERFRYSGFDLTQLAWSRRDERWLRDGDFVFIARPYLRCHVLLLSASLTADYAGHRLGRGPVASPFERTRFLHSASRILNLRNRCGADRHFKANSSRILDTFALLVARNVLEGRSTVIIAKKKSKKFCADYLRERLAGWGIEVRFLVEDASALPATPDPRVIPVLHYGILGTNDYSEYESAYCVTSYYVRTDVLNDQLHEFEPDTFRVRLGIRAGPDRRRRVVIEQRAEGDRERLYIGQVYLDKLEVDPVVQVAGRVRFMTKAREVVFFQMADLAREIPGCRDVHSLGELRRELRLPEAKDVDRWVQANRGRRMMDEGLTAAQAAERLGISRETLFRRLREAESVKTHIGIFLYMPFDTPGAAGEGSA